jgi:hypothetical protein
MRALILAVLMLAARVQSASAVDWHGPNFPHYDHYDRPKTCRVGWEWVLIDEWDEWRWSNHYGWHVVTVRQWQQRRVMRCR